MSTKKQAVSVAEFQGQRADALYMLLDITSQENTRLLKVCDRERIILWGKYYTLKGLRVIAPPLGRFTKLDMLSMQYLFWNMTKHSPANTEEELIQTTQTFILNNAHLDTTPIVEIESLIRELAPALEAAETTITKDTVKKIVVTGELKVDKVPTSGVTKQVWETADTFAQKAKGMPDRSAVVKYCIENLGIHKATAATQWAKWKNNYLATH